jgi:hypothetical protein
MNNGWDQLQRDAAHNVKPMFQGFAVEGAAQRSVLQLWEYFKNPSTPWTHYYDGAMCQVDGREWIRWTLDVLGRYPDMWSYQGGTLRTRRDVMFMYPKGHVTALQTERPLGLVQQLYCFEGHVSAVLQ